MTSTESPETTTLTGGSDDRVTPASRRGPGRTLFTVLGIAVLVAGTFAYLAVRHHEQQNGLSGIRATGIPADVPTSVANEMGLSPVPTRSAPNFTLVDQRGRSLSLDSFRGRSVVLEFMDPHCVDVCPIVSREFVDAYHDLGKAASRVVFVAVNVNQYYAGVPAIASFSRSHQLDTIPSWHFFTGPATDLKAVWHDFGVEVSAPNPSADIVHTSIVYFIDPSGHERYVAAPMVDHTAKGKAYLPSGPLTTWGQGIALVARSFSK